MMLAAAIAVAAVLVAAACLACLVTGRVTGYHRGKFVTEMRLGPRIEELVLERDALRAQLRRRAPWVTRPALPAPRPSFTPRPVPETVPLTDTGAMRAITERGDAIIAGFTTGQDGAA